MCSYRFYFQFQLVVIARQHATHAEHDVGMANPSICPSVTLWYCTEMNSVEMNGHIVKLYPPLTGV